MNLSTTEATSEKALRELKLRDQYLLEKARIIDDIGDLESIRLSLGLSQRKLCKLLLVDPSAWTRWIKTDAPPHIYQALNWLVQLRKTNPDAMLSQSLDSKVDLVQIIVKKKTESLEREVLDLKEKLNILAGIQTHSQEIVSDVDVYELKAKMAMLLELSTPPKRKRKVAKKKKVKAKKKVRKKKTARKKRRR